MEVYSLALGANAGATVAAGSRHWGPTPSTRIPIFYTTLFDACAILKTVTPVENRATATGAVERRDARSTTSTVTYTATSYMTTGVVDCPVSSQSTSIYTTVTTFLSTSMPLIQNSVTSAVSFGTNVKAMASLDGTPVSYIPPPPTSSNGDGAKTGSLGDDNPGGHHRKIVIGLCVGLLMPIMIAIIAGAV